MSPRGLWTLHRLQGHPGVTDRRRPSQSQLSLSLGHSVSSVTHSLRASGKPAAPGHTRLHRIECTAVWPTECVEAGNCPYWYEFTCCVARLF